MSRFFPFIALIFFVAFFVPIFAGHSAAADRVPTELDKLLDANPLPLPADKDIPVSTANGTVFQVQLAALSDMDSAQTRKVALEQMLGGKVDLVFDPPYYKLRFGTYATKQEAEDELVDLAGKDIQGFVVRQ